MAQELVRGITAAGYGFAYEPMTNQVFPIFPSAVVEELAKTFGFYVWTRLEDGSVVIRLVTSWATKREAVEAFISAVENERTHTGSR